MYSSIVLATTLLASLSAASICVEKTTDLPEGWTQLQDTVNPDSTVQFAIAMRQPEIHKLQSTIFDILPLTSHLSLSATNLLRTPNDDEVSQVMQWLRDAGIESAQQKNDWINVQTTVRQAEALLQTKLSHYTFGDMAPVLRTTEYHVPDDLENAIDFIHPLTNFMTPEHTVGSFKRMPASTNEKREDPPCSQSLTPKCIRQMYKVNYKAPGGKSDVRFAIAGFLEQYANYADYEQFAHQLIPEIAATGYNFSVELVHGGQNLQDLKKSGIEASLDIQYGMALAYPAKVTFFATGGRGVQLDENGKGLPADTATNEPFLELLQHFLDMPDSKLPHILSLSYADDEVSVPRPYAERVCNMMGMLTGRGMSIFGGTGDGGAMGAQKSTCKTGDGTHKNITMPTFPASCPWVTSVGATTNADGPPTGAMLSGGGFSRYFKVPDWQKKDTGDYINKLNGHLKGYYDPNMRGMPDISAVGTEFAVITASVEGLIDGTSASTPVIASLIALVNDARFRKGKKSIGWLNPILYSPRVRGLLQDVTTGQSKSCNFDGFMPGGWPAKAGWDAMTGLGVPNDFGKLLSALVDA
ncbi:hypothetical protein VHEMI00226 [[Torrubiella] hemipterigena]|uniref:tripeptidyl-peptidase II n=1 Tax=[Torrubiella] hemipterigena TaxID=1531966 RepID=A0A0A1T3W3_9HYPO|nr:hypothetical protein VHEMI00226 [[Torrubiella] hemipterigena]